MKQFYLLNRNQFHDHWSVQGERAVTNSFFKKYLLMILLVASLGFINYQTFAQCTKPVNDGNIYSTGTSNPHTTVAPVINRGSTTAGVDETRVFVYMNTVNQFDIPSELTSMPANTAYGSAVAYNGFGQQLVANFSDASPQNLLYTNNLEPNSPYYFQVVKVTRCGSEYTINDSIKAAYTLGRTTSLGLSENITAKDMVFGTVGDNNIPLNSFTGITSPTAPTGYVIKMNTSNSFTPITDGTSAASLTANTVYGGGEQIVYVGASDAPGIDITGLSADTEYYFQVYGYYGIYYQQTGSTAIKSTTTAKPSASITLTGSTAANMTATVFDADITLSATTNSSSSLIYQIVEAPYNTSLSGSTITLGKAGTIVVDVLAPGDGTYSTAKETITITVNKAQPTLSFANDTILAGNSEELQFSTSSDGLISFSIIGADGGNSLGDIHNNTRNKLFNAVNGGTVVQVRATVAESPYYEAGSVEGYITVMDKDFYVVSGETKLFKIADGVETTLVDFAADATNKGNTPRNVSYINGKLFGTTSRGGANGHGTLYMVDTDGSNFTKIMDFTSNPYYYAGDQCRFYEFNNKIYVTLQEANAIVRMDLDGTNASIILQMDGSTFILPNGLAEYNGKLYGTAANGGSGYSSGGVFSMNYDGSGYTVVYNSTTGDSRSRTPYGPPIINGDNLYYFQQSGTYMTYYYLRDNYFVVAYNYGVGYYPMSLYHDGTYYHTNTDARYAYSNNRYTFTSPISALSGPISYMGAYGLGAAYDASSKGIIYQKTLSNFGAPTIIYTSTTEKYVGDVAFISTTSVTPLLTFNNQTVDAHNLSTLAAATSSTGAITYELVGDVTGSVINGDKLTAGNVGTVTIRATVAANGIYETASAEATFTIQKTDPTVSYNDLAFTYAEPTYTLSPASTNYTGGTITYQFVDGASLVATGPNTGSSISGDQLSVGNQGTETIRATLPATGNFNEATVDFQLSIEKATLTVTAVNASREYGDANPTFTLSYSGFKSGEDQSVLDIAPVGTSSATLTTPAGYISFDGYYPYSYDIIPAGGSDNNYNFNYVNGTLTISRAPLTVAAKDTSMYYGDTPPASYEVLITGIKNSDNISGNFAAYTSVNNTSAAGTYPVVASGPTYGLDNYQATLVNGVFTVNKAILTVTADNMSKEFEDENPVFTFTYSGFKNSQDYNVINTQPTGSSTALTNSPLGDYPITLSGGDDDNYTFNYVDGTLTISKKSQTLAFPLIAKKTTADAPFLLSATTQQGISATYSSSNTNVATVSGNTVTIQGPGTAIISATAEGDATHKALSGVERTIQVYEDPVHSSKMFGTLKNNALITVESGTHTIIKNFDANTTEGNWPYGNIIERQR